MKDGRTHLAHKAEHAVFDRQDLVPAVIVSDNSTESPIAFSSRAIDILSPTFVNPARLSMTEHHNACLRLPRTPWAILLHDDELCDNVMTKVCSLLANAVVGIPSRWRVAKASQARIALPLLPPRPIGVVLFIAIRSLPLPVQAWLRRFKAAALRRAAMS